MRCACFLLAPAMWAGLFRAFWLPSFVHFSCGTGLHLQMRQVPHGVSPVGTAHFGRGHQSGAHRRALRLPKNKATRVNAQLNAAHPGRLALGHAGDRRADGGGGATGTAAGAAFHGCLTTLLIAVCACQAGARGWFCVEWSTHHRVQTLRCPQHLIDHGAHAIAVGCLHQGALVVECAARIAQCKGLGCQPAFQVDQQGRQVAL